MPAVKLASSAVLVARRAVRPGVGMAGMLGFKAKAYALPGTRVPAGRGLATVSAAPSARPRDGAVA